MKSILITGINGFIGKKLTESLTHDYRIRGVVRNISRARERLSQEISERIELVEWNAKENELIRILSDTDIVINLAGKSIVKGLWTENNKKEIYESRIFTTKKLIDLILKLENKPQVFINASAVGYYGFDINKISDENSEPSNDFLGRLCVDWENASAPVEKIGIRRVLLRISTVLSKEGGALPLLALPFKFYFGMYFGTGRQYLPWIHEKDLIKLFRFIIEKENISGPVNAVSPHSVTMKEFCKTLGKVLKRPCLIRVPEWKLKLLIGEMSSILIGGGRVIPQKLIDSGFEFEYELLELALKDLFA